MVELVVPSNNLPILQAAVKAGADSVYAPLTGKLAIRMGRDFFALNELAEIIRFVHRAGKKVYAVTNGLIDESELNVYFGLSKIIAEMGADGLVVGSLALVNYISQEIKARHPAFKIIISSTLGAISGDDAEFFRSLGADRIIIPRLHTMDEVVEYRKKTEAELELFAHGLICPVMEGPRCAIPTLCYGADEDPYTCLPRSLEKGKKAPAPCSFYKTSQGEAFWQATIQSDISLLDRVVAAGIDSVKVIPVGKTLQDSVRIIDIWRKTLDSVLEGNPVSLQENEAEINRCSPFTVDFHIREKCR